VMRYSFKKLAACILMGYVGLLLTVQIAMGTTPDTPYRVAIFISHDIDAYRTTLTGIQQRFTGESIRTVWDLYQLEGSPEEALRCLSKAKGNGTHLIISLGTVATETICRKAPQIPIVGGLLLKPGCLKNLTNGTGVTLEISPEVSLQWILKVIPSAQNIGVMYNPVENQATIEKALIAAGRLGITLHPEAVRKPTELPKALKAILKRSDVIWGVPDAMILNPKTAKTILLSSFRNRIPFFGPSMSWTKAGAFQALGHDYTNMGDQCARVAIRILKGEKPELIPIVPLEDPICYINQKTAWHMKIKLPDTIKGSVVIIN
jgi:putative tryptophan/tyrosine transport system substrate-binding protein